MELKNHGLSLSPRIPAVLWWISRFTTQTATTGPPLDQRIPEDSEDMWIWVEMSFQGLSFEMKSHMWHGQGCRVFFWDGQVIPPLIIGILISWGPKKKTYGLGLMSLSPIIWKPWKSKDYFLNGFSAKTIVLVGIYNQQFKGTILFMVFDFQRKCHGSWVSRPGKSHTCSIVGSIGPFGGVHRVQAPGSELFQ